MTMMLFEHTIQGNEMIVGGEQTRKARAPSIPKMNFFFKYTMILPRHPALMTTRPQKDSQVQTHPT